MAEVNVNKQSNERERGLERRSQGGGLSRHEQSNLPGFWSSPTDLFTMNPFSLMRRLTEDMDRMFSGGGQRSGFGNWSPAVEVRESDGALTVCAELPGLSKDDVKVEINNNTLIIEGERKREWNEEKEGIHRSERSYGSFYRAVALPEGAQMDQAKAEFNNGVLEIKVPIPQEESKRRQIPIESGAERKPLGSESGSPQATQTSKAG